MHRKHGSFIGGAGWAVWLGSMSASCMILRDRDRLTIVRDNRSITS
jgi:hypothetical protein